MSTDNLREGATGYPKNIEMSFLEKIFWRIKFLLWESWGKDLDIIFLSISSSGNRGTTREMARLLNKKKIIQWDKKNNFFRYNNFIFYYKDINNLPIDDFISIWSSESKYLQRNFIENISYNMDGPYEKGLVKLEKGDKVIDAGANIGLFSFLAGQKVGQNGKVYAFEPIKAARELLKKNITLNKVDNIQVFLEALGGSDRNLEFAIPESLGESSPFHQGNFPKEKVKQVTLDDFVEKNNLKKVDFIKADIEGMERDLLKGAENAIKKFKPKISICIYHRPDDPQVLKNLIKKFVPEYKIEMTPTKLYAWVD